MRHPVTVPCLQLCEYPWGLPPTSSTASRLGPSWEHVPGGGSYDRKVALWGRQRGKKIRFWCFLLMPVVWEDSDMHRQPEEGRGCWRWLQAFIQDEPAHS